MEIKDYLHFYIGQRCVTPFGVMVLSYFNPKSRYKAWFTDDYEENRGHLYENNVTGHAFFMTEFKPILRKLSDMTEKDGLAIFGSETKYLLYRKEARELGADLWLFTANEYTRLLKAGFDCHDLIPNGLAIDNKSL